MASSGKGAWGPWSTLLWIALCWALTAACRRELPKADTFKEPRGARSIEAEAADAATLTALAEPGSAAAEADGARRRELTWRFAKGPFGATEVVISIPAAADPATRFPVLVALHGRGESLKGSRRGARGWLDDYALGRAMSRLGRPPLGKRDFEGYVSRERLRRINRALGEEPFAELIVVCPFLPDVLHRERAFEEVVPLAAFIVDELLPRVYAETPALGTAASTGIDGVSLGGRAALLVGLSRPSAFGAVGALQGALDDSEIGRFTELGAAALAENPQLVLRLLTSAQDHFLRVNQRLSAALSSRGVQHRFVRVLGTHGYRFNRGPGAIEMLLFHDRALRGLPLPF